MVMAEIHETAEIHKTEVQRDSEGRVIGKTERVERTLPRRGFGWGMLLGLLIVMVAIVAFAYSQGSFQEAGREADVAAQEAQQEVGAAMEQSGDALESAGDAVEGATDNAN